MVLTARHIMNEAIKIIDPETPFSELDRAFLEAKVNGFPVVTNDGSLVGMVSRSDIVRQLGVEQSVAEMIVDDDRERRAYTIDAEQTRGEIGGRLGQHIERQRVRDIMSHDVISVAADTPLQELAQRFMEHGVHRLPVIEGKRLVGIVTTFDLIGLIADGELTVDRP